MIIQASDIKNESGSIEFEGNEFPHQELKGDKDGILREEIISSCENSGIVPTIDIITALELRFMVDKNKEIKPLSLYNDMSEYLKRHKHGAPTIKSMMNSVDKRIQKKEEVYEEMVQVAKLNDMKQYRRLREEYSQL